jgi:transcriptional regulator with XRE-family HTH domain
MSTDPINRLPAAFGKLLSRWLRDERRVTYQQVAVALDLYSQVLVVEMEVGKREPTLTQLFQLADALGEPPAILFVDIVTAWRTDPSDRGVYKSRASDFARLYRLGYHHKPGDFRELDRTYDHLPIATHTAQRLNEQRRSRGVAPLDTVCTYVRLDYSRLDESGQEVQP